ncbi:MAG: Maf family protein [Bacillota bacterium]
MAADFILASASPRRRQLLEQLGLRFEVRAAEVDETPRAGEAAEDYVLRVACLKAETAAGKLESPLPVLAADTEVVLDGKILGKPKGREDGLTMLARLSGRSHQVLSAVALWKDGVLETARCESRVSFRALARGEAEAYWESGEPRDKAGAYGIQGRGAVFVERLEGSYSNVVGLPLFETAALLRSAGVRVL